MATTPLQLAKRALVTLLLLCARQYEISALAINQDSPDKVILDAFKKTAAQQRPGQTLAIPSQRRSNSFCNLFEGDSPFHPLESSMLVEGAAPYYRF